MGLTEEIIGEWLAKQPKELRAKLVIASKVAGPSTTRGALLQREKTMGAPPPPDTKEQRHTPDQIRRALEASLKRLQTSYVDLYQLHWPDRPVPLWGKSVYTRVMFDGVYPDHRPKDAPAEPGTDKMNRVMEDVARTMGELIAEGKIRAWGLSNETPMGVTLYCEAAKRVGAPLPVSLQQDFSLVDRRYEEGLVEACSHYGLKLLAYGPLCGGTLSGKYHTTEEAKRAKEDWRHVTFPNFQARYHAPDTMEATGKYLDVAKRHGLTGTQLALGWCATRWYMGSVIIGANSLEHLTENIDAVRSAVLKGTITPQVEADVDAVHMQKKNPNVSM